MSEEDDRREESKRLLGQTADRLKELDMMSKSERIDWVRKSPSLRRDITVYLDVLTPEQKQRLNEIEQELLSMAWQADEQTTTKRILKRPKRGQDEEPQ